ncbi:MAG: DinB family protein [Bacteroidota bacterium]
MDRIALLRQELWSTKALTENLIKDIPQDRWLESPAVLGTHLNWQLGHISIANYLHGIASLTGRNVNLVKSIPIERFVQLYAPGSSPLEGLEERLSPTELLSLYEDTFAEISQRLDAMNDADLDAETAIPNHRASTKYEALAWAYKHQMWHNGQIATLKRILLTSQ